MKKRIVSSLCALVLSVASCSDGTGPGIDSRYVLESINGAAVPVTVFYGSTVQRIESDTLVFSIDGKGYGVERGIFLQESDQSSAFRNATEFVWRVHEGKTEVTYVCPDLGSCIRGPHLSGVVAGDRLSMQVTFREDETRTYVKR